MPYIGNTIRAADDYRLIDDISSSFNGSDTSFALQVAGSAPVPFPKSPQQVLISVNGVIQEPDPTGASGFNLVGTNIVFSSAPTNGHAFFGIIYATADYLNSGGNFPSGSLGAPSITFVGDEDTGIYRKGSGSVAFVADSTEIANTDSNGITISSGNLIIPDSIIHNGDSNTKIRFPAADTVSVETGGSERLRITSAGRLGLGNNSPDARLSVTDTSTFTAYASSVPSVSACMQQLQNSPSSEAINNHSTIQFGVNGGTHNRVNSISAVAESASNRKLAFTFCTDSGSNRSERLRISADGHVLPGADSTYDIGSSGNRFANGYFDTLYGDGSNLTGINTDLVSDTSPQLGGDLDTNSFEITLDDAHKIKFGDGNDLTIQHSGNHAFIDNLTGNIYIRNDGSNDDSEIHIMARNDEESIVCHDDGAVDLYHNGSKKFETTSSGVTISGGTVANGHITLPDHTGSQDGKLRFGASTDFEIFHNGTSNNTEVNHTTNTGHLQITGNRLKLMNYDGPETYIDCISNGAVELYYDNSKKFETTSTGIQVEDKVQIGTNDNDVASLMVRYSTVPTTLTSSFDGTNGEGTLAINNERTSDGSGAWAGVNNGNYKSAAIRLTSRTSGADVQFWTNANAGNPVHRATINSSGNFVPALNNAYNIGSSSERWANIYTNDLNLSNEGSSNDVDSTWGNYTIQEGHEDLFLINNRTGKKFKFNLTEVS